MPRARSILVLTVLLFVACLPTLADTIHLKTGGELEGELVEETPTHYLFKINGLGTQRIRKADVLRLEKTERPHEAYVRRRKEIEEGDAEAHYRLGLWCVKAGLEKEAEREFRATIAIQTDHAGAREKLGHILVDGKWLDAAAARREEANRKEEAAERAKAEAEAERKAEQYFLDHCLSESYALPGKAWFWPPRGWDPEKVSGGAVFTGPSLLGVHPKLAVGVVAEEAEQLRKQIAQEVEGSNASKEFPLPVRFGSREVRSLCSRIAGEGPPVSRFDVILDRGDDRVHLRLEGPAAAELRLFLLLSDICDSLSFEAPPLLGSELIAYAPPNEDWKRGEGLFREVERRVGRGRGTLWAGPQVSHRKLPARIQVHATSMPGTSRSSLREANSHWFEDGGFEASWDRAWQRKVAGREALCVPSRIMVQGMAFAEGFFCFFAKGDRTFTVIASDDSKKLGAGLRQALEQFLDTVRIK